MRHSIWTETFSLFFEGTRENCNEAVWSWKKKQTANNEQLLHKAPDKEIISILLSFLYFLAPATGVKKKLVSPVAPPSSSSIHFLARCDSENCCLKSFSSFFLLIAGSGCSYFPHFYRQEGNFRNKVSQETYDRFL